MLEGILVLFSIFFIFKVNEEGELTTTVGLLGMGIEFFDQETGNGLFWMGLDSKHLLLALGTS